MHKIIHTRTYIHTSAQERWMEAAQGLRNQFGGITGDMLVRMVPASKCVYVCVSGACTKVCICMFVSGACIKVCVCVCLYVYVCALELCVHAYVCVHASMCVCYL